MNTRGALGNSHPCASCVAWMHRLRVKRVFFSTGLSLPPLLPDPPPLLPPLPFPLWDSVNWTSAKVAVLVEQLRGEREGVSGVAAYTTNSQKMLRKGRNGFKDEKNQKITQ